MGSAATIAEPHGEIPISQSAETASKMIYLPPRGIRQRVTVGSPQSATGGVVFSAS